MKIKCDAGALHDACDMAKAITPRRATLPIIQYAYLEAKRGKVTLRVTDLELMAVISLEAEVEESGACLINPKRCLEFSKGQKGSINISTDKSNAVSFVTESGVKLKLSTDDKPKDFPQLTERLNAMPKLTALPEDIWISFQQVLHCVATDDGRPILTGVNFDFKESELSLVSADGFRTVIVDEPHKTKQPFSMIVPAQTVAFMARYMRDDIKYGYDADKPHAYFASDGVAIMSQTIQGNYPQYGQLIPGSEPAWTIKCNGAELRRAIKQMTNEGAGIVRMYQDGEKLKVSSRAGELEEIEAVVTADMTGKGKIAFFKDYLVKDLPLFHTVTIEVTDLQSPLKITGDPEGVTYVLMPMIVEW